MNSIPVTKIDCSHQNHLFSDIFCENQSLIKKIATVAFHILTLGIPLGFYHIFTCCYSRPSDQKENIDLKTQGVKSVLQNKSIKPYSSVGQEALDFARKKLSENPNIQPKQFKAGWCSPEQTHQPVNQEIARLTTLYNDEFEKFEILLKETKIDPWSNQEITIAADTLMKLGFAISNLTLDDLHSFTEVLSSKGIKRTYVEALTEQDSYQYRTFYICTTIYHDLRGAIEWTLKDLSESDLIINDQKTFEGLAFPENCSMEHSKRFYEKGTIQNTWNALYNEYCDRVRLFVDEKKLQEVDNRHFMWTRNDTSVETFKNTPSTLPS